MGGIWEASRGIWRTYRRHLRGIQEASGRHLEASGRHLEARRLWEAPRGSGEPKVLFLYCENNDICKIIRKFIDFTRCF